MKIGITYDLITDYLDSGFSEEEAAEFDRAETIEGIENALRYLEYETDRIGSVKNLIQRLVSGDRWDMVFNIAEGIKGFAREAQIPAILEVFDIPYTFSDPMVLALTLHKGMTKHVVRDSGIPTPDFCVAKDLKDLDRITLPFPLFAKPVAEGTGKGITSRSKVRTEAELYSVCQDLFMTYDQPILIETFLPGREFTVGITGTGKKSIAIGVMEVLLGKEAEPDVYSFSNKKEFEERVSYVCVDDSEARYAAKIALDAWRCLGCRDGGRVDVRSDKKGIPHFLEVNPLAGLNPEISDLPILCRLSGITYIELIDQIMESAMERVFFSFFDGRSRFGASPPLQQM